MPVRLLITSLEETDATFSVGGVVGEYLEPYLAHSMCYHAFSLSLLVFVTLCFQDSKSQCITFWKY